MNRIEKGKQQLKWLGISIAILSVIALIGSVLCFVFGAQKAVAEGFNYLTIVAIILICLALIGVVISIYFIWLARAVIATHGSIAEDNLCIGTVNMKKCAKCGNEIKDGEEFCKNCGDATENKKCECGQKIDKGSKFCSKCGKTVK